MTVVPLRKVEPIGGSEAAAACGVDPHTSRTMLWLYKTGRVERPETEAMEWGKRLEDDVLDGLMARGWALESPVHDHYRDPERPWLIGHPDHFGVPPDEAIEDPDSRVGVEVKTVNQWAKRGWNGPPIEYVAQCQLYMHLTGMPEWLLAVLVGGQKLETHVIRCDEGAIRKMLALIGEFYGYLVRDEPPPPDGSESSRDAVGLLYPEHEPERRVRFGKADMAALRALKARRGQRDVVNEQIRALENGLKVAMKQAEVAISPHDDEVIRWKAYPREAVDVTALREAHPEIAAEFVKTTTTRRFQVL